MRRSIFSFTTREQPIHGLAIHIIASFRVHHTPSFALRALSVHGAIEMIWMAERRAAAIHNCFASITYKELQRWLWTCPEPFDCFVLLLSPNVVLLQLICSHQALLLPLWHLLLKFPLFEKTEFTPKCDTRIIWLANRVCKAVHTSGK